MVARRGRFVKIIEVIDHKKMFVFQEKHKQSSGVVL